MYCWGYEQEAVEEALVLASDVRENESAGRAADGVERLSPGIC
jgi:hypothetical protein